MNLFAISVLSVCITSIVLAAVTLISGKTKLHRQLLLFNLALSVWGAGLFVVGIADSAAAALLGWKIAHIGGFFIGPLFFHLVAYLIGIRRRKLLIFGYSQAVFFILVSLTTGYIFNKTRIVSGIFFIEINPYYFLGFVFYALFVILSYYELFRFLPKSQGFKRTQLLYIIFGFMTGFLGGSVTFLPMFHIDALYQFGNFGISLYVFVLGYAILRNRLVDIHLVFRKSLVYSISAGVLTGLFILLVLFMTEMLSDLAGISSFSITVVSALVIATLFNPIKNRVQLLIDRIFYKISYDYYMVIQQVGRELVSTITLKHVYEIIVEPIYSILKLKSAYLLSKENSHFKVVYSRQFKAVPSDHDIRHPGEISSESQLVRLLNDRKEIQFKEELRQETGQYKADNIERELGPYMGEVVVPIFIDSELTFLMIFGEKLSGDMFSDEDIQLLSTIANQGAIALKNALLYDAVEKKVEERTSELRASQVQLVQSEKLSAMGQLAAGLAHELNSPLSGLVSLIKHFRGKAAIESEEYKDLTLMFNSCRHMAKIVKDFSSFSRKSEGEFSDLDLQEVIESTLSLIGNEIKQKKIELTKEYNGKLPGIRGNITELQQVVLNIIVNAVDAMEDRGRLIIRTEVEADERHVKMIFIDNGSGILKENIDRIFDPFFTTKAYGKGVGLGLSVSYGIIKNHSGEIKAESEFGKGAKITVSLPAIH